MSNVMESDITKIVMIFTFSKHESLKDNIVLDPQWLVNSFRCLITNEKFCRKKRFYKQWLEFNKTAVFSKELVRNVLILYLIAIISIIIT